MNRSMLPLFRKQNQQAQTITSLKTDLAVAQGELNTAKEALQHRIRMHEDLLAEHEDSTARLEEQCTTLTAHLKAKQEQIAGVQDNLSACVTYLQEVQPQVEHYQQLEERYAALSSDYVALHITYDTLRAQVADREEKIRMLENDVARLQHKKLPHKIELATKPA